MDVGGRGKELTGGGDGGLGSEEGEGVRGVGRSLTMVSMVTLW